MRALIVLLVALAAGPAPAAPPPPPVTIDMLRGDMIARSGGDTIYFANDGHALDAAARASLTAQAQWLSLHPEVLARVEGHADERETRARALAVGERRAAAVRDFLILEGVPATQLSLISWGKERPKAEGSAPMAIALNRRVVLVLLPR